MVAGKFTGLCDGLPHYTRRVSLGLRKGSWTSNKEETPIAPHRSYISLLGFEINARLVTPRPIPLS